MTAYNYVPLGQRLPGEPWTASKVNASLDNPIAITEGAPGAPRNSPAALAQYALSLGETFVAPSGTLAGGAWSANVNMDTIAGSETSQISYQTSTDGGGSWAAAVILVSVQTADDSTNITKFDIASFPAGTDSVRLVETRTGSATEISAIMTVWGA